MDIEIDRAQGLHSVPADYGIARALWISRALHVLSVIAMASVGLMLGLGPIYAIGVVAVALLLAYEQQLVSPTDLSRVNMAFLSVNGVIALLYLGAVSLDVALLVTPPRLELRGVGHAYGGRVVLAGVERVLEPGRSLGLLGPNGSGKSTLLRCIAGLLRPRAGHVLVDGRESCELPPAERARVAYAGHRPLLWGGLSARENLLLCAGLYGLGRGLPRRRRWRRPASTDHGRRARPPRSRRASGSAWRWPARSCPHPQLLVLDEPHSGLDEASAARLDARARRGRAGSVTLVLATHERARAERLCDELHAAGGAALSAQRRAVRARRAAARAHRHRARAPRAAARAGDGAVRGRRAGRAALRRRHRAPARRA